MSANIPPSAPIFVADALARLFELWGVKRTTGMIWGTLYLSPTPLAARDICERLDISAGAVSMAVSELEAWGVVRRFPKPGERSQLLEADGSPWRLIRRLAAHRELAELDRFIVRLESALAEAELFPTGTETRYATERVAGLLRMAHLAYRVLSALVQERRTIPDTTDSVDVNLPSRPEGTPPLPRAALG